MSTSGLLHRIWKPRSMRFVFWRVFRMVKRPVPVPVKLSVWRCWFDSDERGGD